MARPYSDRPNHAVPISVGDEAQPALTTPAAGVDIQTPGPETSPLAGLIQALGIGANAFKAYSDQRNDYERKQGIADAQLGQADPNKVPKLWRKSYADGAFETSTLDTYQKAEQKVAQRATDELDKSLPLDDQVRVIDGWMKEELGPMVTDPRAKGLIAERYQTFIHTAAANILKNQTEAHAQEAQDVVLQDVSQQIERNGSFDWNQSYHLLNSQNGDPSKTTELLVGTVAQAMTDAAARGDPNWKKYRDLIPSQVIGPDGSKLPGPAYSPKYRGILQQADAEGQRQFDQFNEESYAQKKFEAYSFLDTQLANGNPVTDDTFASKGYTIGTKPGDILSPSIAAQYKQTSLQLIAKANAKAAEYNGFVEARSRMGRIADTLGVPGGPDTQEKLKQFTNQWFQQILAGGGATIDQMGGTAMVSNPQLVDTVARLSAQEGVPYEPLKQTLSSINPAAPGDVTARLDAYKILKARNLVGMYVDDQSALTYEVALAAQRAGEKPEGIANAIRDMGDKDRTQYVDFNMSQSKLRKTGAEVPTGNLILARNINTNNATNAPQISALLEGLTKSALSSGLSLTDAEQFAKDRLKATFTALPVGETWAIVPNTSIPGGNAQKVTEALDWYVRSLPTLAKKRDIPADEQLTVRPTYGLGRKLEFEVTRMGGVEVPKTRFTLEGLMQAFYAANPSRTAKGQADELHREVQAEHALQNNNSLPMMRRH